ncbi:discoidin domain-containing protein [Nocardia alni]|uniref:discoidin domain-containing protein n=1 Tax=Nocardia alni TaxID=2815723 RepID=UPI0027E161B4|nr:discoidin domain-containing protein [Nocardia alni]
MASTRWATIGRRSRLLIGVGVVAVLVVAAMVVIRPWRGAPAQTYPCTEDSASVQPQWAPASADYSATYDRHPFVGNGYLGLRVPPAGMGYVQTGERTGWPLYTPRYDGAFVAGLYARDPAVADGLSVAAALPVWSTLQVQAGGDTYSAATPAGQVSNFRQTEYQRCGLVRTALTWTARDGRVTDLVYDVMTDRADQHAAAVHLTVSPRWRGELAVTGQLDFAGARRIDRTATVTPNGHTTDVEFRTRTTNVVGDVAAVLYAGDAPVQQDATGQHAKVAVAPGNTYEFTKFVGVDTSLTSRDPQRAALDTARRVFLRGWAELLAEQSAVWAGLWDSDIEVPGRPDMQNWIHGALYSLYSATNPEQDNSISPTGLSSDNYGGLIFWDADIWMYPPLLQFAPDLARSVVEYRYKTLPGARANAQRLGYPGAFYPWTGADTGDLWTECHSWSPPHCLTQIHLQGDISLAAWQYYLVTGDLGYLRSRSWPIMSALAEFWAARAKANPDGSYSIDDVAGPDEYSNGVDDGVYTNGVAALALRDAAAAARLIGVPAPPQWSQIADHLRMPFDARNDVFQQYDGYRGSQIKQADTVLLEYPLEWPMSPQTAAKTLAYYAGRTDPDGPAMTDSVHEIDAAAQGIPGCSIGAYLDRSVRPFVRPPFGQFAEARGNKAGATDPLAGSPAFDFDTAAGGFVQEFTNGLLGLRFREDRVRVDPVLPPQLGEGVAVHGIQWQARIFDAEIGPRRTVITLRSGAALPVETATGLRRVEPGASLELPTRRPDLTPTADAARCKLAMSDSAQPGDYAEAAVDGDPGTAWVPDSAQGALTVDLGAVAAVTRVVPQWTDPAPNLSSVDVSTDEQTWTPAALKADGELITPLYARYVRVTVRGADPSARPGISDLDIRTN